MGEEESVCVCVHVYVCPVHSNGTYDITKQFLRYFLFGAVTSPSIMLALLRFLFAKTKGLVILLQPEQKLTTHYTQLH